MWEDVYSILGLWSTKITKFWASYWLDYPSLPHLFQPDGCNNLYHQGYKQTNKHKSEKNLYYRLLLKIKYMFLCALKQIIAILEIFQLDQIL